MNHHEPSWTSTTSGPWDLTFHAGPFLRPSSSLERSKPVNKKECQGGGQGLMEDLWIPSNSPQHCNAYIENKLWISMNHDTYKSPTVHAHERMIWKHVWKCLKIKYPNRFKTATLQLGWLDCEHVESGGSRNRRSEECAKEPRKEALMRCRRCSKRVRKPHILGIPRQLYIYIFSSNMF